MFHPDTQFLIDHWFDLSRRPGVRAGLPDRAALAPELLGPRLPRVFLAARAGDDALLRLAGGWIEAFHGQAPQGQFVSSLWRTASRPLVLAAIAQTVREARPVVVAAVAGSISTSVEVVMAPLRDSEGRPDLILGLYAPSSLALTAEEPRRLTARVSIGVGDPGRAPLSLAAVSGRRIA